MLKIALHFAWRGFGHFARLVLLCCVLLLFAGAGALLMLRYWLLPDIEHYHDQVTYSVSQAIGRPVSIGRIEADWEGVRPHLLMINVRILDQQGQTALALEQVESEVSWTSLFAGEVRLYSLELDQPDLFIKRDADGRLFVAGMLLSGNSSSSGSADWLLNQSRIVVRDARITWQDDQRAAPPLVLDDVRLLIDNGWFSHRFALRAVPPPELSSEIDVRGDFHSGSFSDPESWHGQIYTRLDYVDVAAWRTWLPLPVPLTRGKGALRSWVDIDRGKISQVTADLALAGVRTRLAGNLPVLDLQTMRGRVGWRDIEHGAEVFTKDLSLRLANGLTLLPTDFFLNLAIGEEQQWTSGEVRANRLNLQVLNALAEYLPLDRSFREKLVAFAPRGRFFDLHGKWQAGTDRPLHYEISGRFNGVAVRQAGKLPGFSGLSGVVDGNQNNGTLSLDSRNLAVDAPGVMQDKLQFDTLNAQLAWKTDEDGLEIRFNNVFVANADFSGNLYGNYHTAPDSPGKVDLTARLTRAALAHVDRYIPTNALGKGAHQWLSTGLVGGQSDDTSMRLVGNLNDFPFPGNKKGMFRIRADIRDATVEFLKEWPRLENMDGQLLIQGNRLEVHAPSAISGGKTLQKISAIFPDLSSPDLALQVYGEAAGDTQKMLDYIRISPVRGYLGGFTDNATAHGNGLLTLLLNIPLMGNKPLRVNGVYHFQDNDIDLGGDIPLLQHTGGDLLFSESSISTRGLTARIFGGPSTLEVKSSDDGKTIGVKASGTSDMDQLRKTSTLPLLRYLHGGSPWDLRVTVRDKQYDALFTSALAGMTSNLPAPFAKSADEKVALRYEQKSLGDGQEELSLQYGDLVDAELLRSQESGEWAVRRGTVAFGEKARGEVPQRKGIWVTGTIPLLSLDGWWPLLETGESGEGASISGADLLIDKVIGYGQSMENLRVTAHSSNDMLFAELASPEINGDVIWQPRDKGALVVRLKNLIISGAGEGGIGAGKPVAATETVEGDSPEFHVSVEHLSYKGKHLGRMEMQAKQRAGNWLVEHMMLTNPDGKLTADGKWLKADESSQTLVNFKLEIGDAGKTLARYGYPNSVKNGGGKLEGSLSWSGSPDQFNPDALNGTLKLDVDKGRFLKIDPGVGKLLGILSLQALPRHITLDFTDVFSEGFAFDNISGTAQIQQGIMNTSDFKIEGSAAKVTMTGLVDLTHETQNLHVTVIPEMGGGVVVLGICVINPAACVGSLIAKQALQNPLEKLVSYEYNITGTWVDPTVVKVGSGKPAATSVKP
jgi:uncharacterized protein (TIGR02099 family)